MGADGFELDVQLTRDDHAVVIHDGSVDRTTNGSGRVSQMALAEIRKLDAGSWFNLRKPRRARSEFVGEKIPTLSEVLELARQNNSIVYIELKFARDSRPGLEKQVIRIINELKLSRRVVIESFKHQSIKLVKELAPELKTAALFGR